MTCFGYLGYKNARFGRIEAHEAVTANGREALLQAKEAAEELGFSILHMYVDGLWIVQPGCRQTRGFPPAAGGDRRPHRAADRAGRHLPLGGVFALAGECALPGAQPLFWRLSGRLAQGARHRGPPPGYARALSPMCRWSCWRCWPKPNLRRSCRRPSRWPWRLLRKRLAELRRGEVAPERLLVGQRLTRKPEEYSDPSAGARAAMQLIAAGREAVPGQRIRFIWLRGLPDVHAWDLPEPVPVKRIDLARYRALLLRAAGTVFLPLGISEEKMEALVENRPLAVPLLPERPQKFLTTTETRRTRRQNHRNGRIKWKTTDKTFALDGYTDKKQESGHYNVCSQ